MYHYQILYVENTNRNKRKQLSVFVEICSKFLLQVIKKAIKNH